MSEKIFKIEKGGKPADRSFKRIPNFEDESFKLNPTSFVVYGENISDLDFSNQKDALDFLTFDNRAIFPNIDKLPLGFDPNKILEEGKNPGLGIRNLHKKGITGKGINVAIIDQRLNTQHLEFKDNLINYRDCFLSSFENNADFHGNAVSSLLCGKSIGVSPDVKLVYFATSSMLGEPNEKPLLQGDRKIYVSSYIKALKRILFINSKLSSERERFSVVSINLAGLHNNQEYTELIKELISKGVFVISCDSRIFYDGKSFCTLDRKINSNPDDINSYLPGYWWKNKSLENCLLIPAGGRTVAGYFGHNNYIYIGAGAGMSWSTPYLAGVYALMKQVYFNITPKLFWDICFKTSEPLIYNDKKYGMVIQPERMVRFLENELLKKIHKDISL